MMNYVMLYLLVKKNAIYVHFIYSLQLKFSFFTMSLNLIKSLLTLRIWLIIHVYFTILILSFITYDLISAVYLLNVSFFPGFIIIIFFVQNETLSKDIHNPSCSQILLLFYWCCFLFLLLLGRANAWHGDILGCCTSKSVRISPEHFLFTLCGVILLSKFCWSHAKTPQLVSI